MDDVVGEAPGLRAISRRPEDDRDWLISTDSKSSFEALRNTFSEDPFVRRLIEKIEDVKSASEVSKTSTRGDRWLNEWRNRRTSMLVIIPDDRPIVWPEGLTRRENAKEEAPLCPLCRATRVTLRHVIQDGQISE